MWEPLKKCNLLWWLNVYRNPEIYSPELPVIKNFNSIHHAMQRSVQLSLQTQQVFSANSRNCDFKKKGDCQIPFRLMSNSCKWTKFPMSFGRWNISLSLNANFRNCTRLKNSCNKNTSLVFSIIFIIFINIIIFIIISELL